MATDLMYDGTPKEEPIKKTDIDSTASLNDLLNISDYDFMRDVVSKYQPSANQIRLNSRMAEMNAPIVETTGDIDDFGSSRFDRRIVHPGQLENLENTRAYFQPGINKLAVSIPKMATLAGTTLVDGTIGSIVGLMNVAQEAINGNVHSFGEGLNAFVQNPMSRDLQEINKASEQIFRNYYSDEERNRSWWQNLGTANFWGDTVMKNLGFVIGAAYSGKLWASGMSKAMGLAEARDAFLGITNELSNATKGASPSKILKMLENNELSLTSETALKALHESATKLKHGNRVVKAVGGITASIGEARIEAINGADEYEDSVNMDFDAIRSQEYENAKQQLLKDHREYFSYVKTPDGKISLECTSPEGQSLLKAKYAEVDSQIEAIQQEIQKNKMIVSNTIFGLNLPVLMASNLIEFGKLFGDFDTSRITAKGLRNMSKSVAPAESSGISFLNTIEDAANKTIAPSSLGTKIAKTTASMMKNAITEGSEEMTQAWISSLAKYKGESDLGEFVEQLYDPKAIVESVTFLDAIREGFNRSIGNPDTWVEGVVGGIMGLFGLPSIGVKVKNGQEQRGIVWHGGIADSIRETRIQNQREIQAVNTINKILNDPEFKNYYYGFIRGKSAEDGMETSVANGDRQGYDKYKHMKLVNDLITFEDAGRLQDLTDMIDALAEDDFSDESLNELKKLAGNEALVKIDNETLRKQMKENARELKQRKDEYVQISNDLKVLYGDTLSTEAMHEMVWTSARLNDLNSQVKNLAKSLSDYVTSYRQSLPESEMSALPKEDIQVITSEGFGRYISHLAKTDENIKANARYKALTSINKTRQKYYDTLARLSTDPTLVEQRMKRINDERAKAKEKAVDKKVIDDISTGIQKYSDLDKYRDEYGNIDSRVLRRLRERQDEGSLKASFILAADSADIEMQEAITSHADTMPQEIIRDALYAWAAHIGETKDFNEIYQPVVDEGGEYIPEAIDFLNEIILQQKAAQKPFQTNPENPGLVDTINDDIREDLVGHEFGFLHIQKPVLYDEDGNAKHSLKDMTHLYFEDGNPIPEGDYYIDETDANNIIVHNLENGDVLGRAYYIKDTTLVLGKAQEELEPATLPIIQDGASHFYENLYYEHVGKVREDGVPPWNDMWTESQAAPVPQRKESPTEKAAPSSPETPTGSSVINRPEEKHTRVTARKVAPQNKPEEKAKPNPHSDDKGTATDKNLFMKPFNVVSETVRRVLKPTAQIRFAVTGGSDTSVIELWHKTEKVGELPTDPKEIERFKGMAELIDMLHSQFNEGKLIDDEATAKKFASKADGSGELTTTVRKIYTGAFRPDTTNIKLSEATNLPAKPTFAVLFPDGKVRASQPVEQEILEAISTKMNVGGVYVLIPTGFGDYIPAVVSPRRISEDDFDIVKNKKHPMAKAIWEASDKLINAAKKIQTKKFSKEAFDKASAELQNLIYFEDKLVKTKDGTAVVKVSPRITFTPDGKVKVIYRMMGSGIKPTNVTVEGLSSAQDIVNELMKTRFAKTFRIRYNYQFTSDVNNIANPNFASIAMDGEDVFLTNISDFGLSDAGFNMDYFVPDDNGGHFETAKAGMTEKGLSSLQSLEAAEEALAQETEPNPVVPDEKAKSSTDIGIHVPEEPTRHIVTVSPYFRQELTKANKQQLIAATRNAINKANEIANMLGLNIETVNTIDGTYLGNSELSYQYIINSDNQAAVDLFASLMADLSFEYQDAVIAANYVNKGEKSTAIELVYSVPENEDIASITKTLKKCGIEGASYNAEEHKIYITAFSKDELNNYIVNLNSKTNYKYEKDREQNSRYLDGQYRRDIYKEWLDPKSGLQSSRPELYNACAKALAICEAASQYDDTSEEVRRKLIDIYNGSESTRDADKGKRGRKLIETALKEAKALSPNLIANATLLLATPSETEVIDKYLEVLSLARQYPNLAISKQILSALGDIEQERFLAAQNAALKWSFVNEADKKAVESSTAPATPEAKPTVNDEVSDALLGAIGRSISAKQPEEVGATDSKYPDWIDGKTWTKEWWDLLDPELQEAMRECPPVL